MSDSPATGPDMRNEREAAARIVEKLTVEGPYRLHKSQGERFSLMYISPRIIQRIPRSEHRTNPQPGSAIAMEKVKSEQGYFQLKGMTLPRFPRHTFTEHPEWVKEGIDPSSFQAIFSSADLSLLVHHCTGVPKRNASTEQYLRLLLDEILSSGISEFDMTTLWNSRQIVARLKELRIPLSPAEPLSSEPVQAQGIQNEGQRLQAQLFQARRHVRARFTDLTAFAELYRLHREEFAAAFEV